MNKSSILSNPKKVASWTRVYKKWWIEAPCWGGGKSFSQDPCYNSSWKNYIKPKRHLAKMKAKLNTKKYYVNKKGRWKGKIISLKVRLPEGWSCSSWHLLFAVLVCAGDIATAAYAPAGTSFVLHVEPVFWLIFLLI